MLIMDKGMDRDQVKKELVEIGKRIYARNMVAANDGNFSVRINENEIICTPTGVSKGYMNEDMMCTIDMQGNVLEAKGGYRPSSEMKMHIRVYEKRDDVRAVVHAHPIYATSFAIAGNPIDRMVSSEAVVNFGGVPVAPYGTPSTAEIPDNIEKYLPYYDAILLERHGALTWSVDLMDAYMKMEGLEFYAQLLHKAMDRGEVTGFSDEEVKKLYEVRERMKLPGKHPASICLHGTNEAIDRTMPGYQYDFTK